MMWKRYIAIILCASLFLLQGCKKEDQQSSPQTVLFNEDIVCPMLYQKNDSIANALKFIEAREDKLESYISSVGQRGGLVNIDQLKFANKLFSVRKSKDTEFFVSLLCEKTKEQLKDDNKNGILLQHISTIKEGTFLYGEYDFKFFATIGKLTKEQRDDIQKRNFTEIPTYNIVYWHFHKPKSMLTGTTFYLIKDNGLYKIVIETPPKDKIPTKL